MRIETRVTVSESMRLGAVTMRAIALCSDLMAADAAKMQSAALGHLSGDGWSGQSLQWDAVEADAGPAAIEQESDKPPVARNARVMATAKVRPSGSLWSRRIRSRVMRTRVIRFTPTSKPNIGSLASKFSVQSLRSGHCSFGAT